MFSKEILEVALSALQQIKADEYSKSAGICYNLNVNAGWDTGDDSQGSLIVKHYARSWSKYSGESLYPVPDHLGLSALIAYTNHVAYMWDKDHPYGKMRWELLDHIIVCIEKELADAH